MPANPTRRRTATATSVALAASTVGVLISAAPAAAAPVAVPAPAIRITEFSYQLRDFGEAEFVELTNVGTTPVNMAGWSFDDSSATAGSFDLSGFGIVAPGESVVFTDTDAATFRTYWGLAETVDVVGGSTQGLGNGDQINIFDDAGNLADRLTYDDTPRSRDNSVVPGSLTDVGANTYDNWALSSTANDPGSVTIDGAGAGTSIGSPGISQYAAGPVTAPALPIRITEFSYQLRDFGEAEFVELTNVGTTAVNLAGWSSSESTTTTGQFDLSGLGIVAAGESVVFTDVTADAFRTYFDLCSAVKVVGGSNPGLGNGDEISIWDDAGNLVDRITYTDSPRSRDNSVVPTSAAALAANDYTAWALSTPANDPGSVTVDGAGAGTSIASPGTSPFATVAFTPSCPPPPTPSSFDLSTYSIVGRYPLPTPADSPAPTGSELATEVSAITYNWDTDTLFVVGDEGTSVVQVSKTGALIDSMSLTGFADTEGISYVGGGQFVIAEERLRTAVLVTYAGGTTLDRSAGQGVTLGTTVGNIGLEGISYDPLTDGAGGLGFIGVKESSPQGIFQTNIDFGAGTATNGSASTENPTNLFDPALVGTSDLSDVFPLSLLPGLDGGTSPNLLIISQEAGRIVNVNRAGAIANQVDIVDAGAPLAVPAQTMEGVTVDRDLVMYTTSEGGGGNATRPQLLVWAPNASPSARLAVTEVAPWGGDANYGADWFELTNTGGQTLDLTGLTVDDSSNSAASSVALTGVSTLAAGESAVFFETTDLPTVTAAFATAWFGDTGLPAGVKIGSYNGTGLGLSGSGDAVNIFDGSGAHLTGVSFGAATPQRTFDNSARLGAAAAPVAISTLASEGVNGAFLADDGVGVGSPWGAAPPPPDPSGDTSGIRITEVAPFGSGNSPYAADWFEVTNTGTESVNLTGWKMDDGSATFTSGVELLGVSVLPAGASAIFFEGTDRAAFELAFAQAWFQQNLFDSGFFFGNYTGGGVGLSTGGDSVVLFDSAGSLITGVTFGASPTTAPFTTFDNAAGLGTDTSPFPTLTTFSAVGVNGAFDAPQADEIGSPSTAQVIVPQPPGPPTGITPTQTGSGRMSIAYTAPTTGTLPITSYRVVCTSADGGTARAASGLANPLVLTGFTPRATYTCRMSATNSVGTSASSSPTSPFVVLATPGAPRGVNVDVDRPAGVRVSFTSPTDAGSSPITSYRALCRGAGGTSRSAAGSSSPLIVTGLTTGVSYTCVVTASNTVGTGPASGASSPITPITVPGAPTLVVAAIPAPASGSARLAVSFDPPAASAAAPVTSYRALCTSPTGAPKSGAGTASPLVVVGLTAGADYSCVVTASNAAGTSAPSSASAVVQVLGPPSAPTGVTVTPTTPGRVAVSFTASASNGGSPITSFRVVCTSSTGGIPRSAAGAGSPITVISLTSGATYTCRVSATNAIGTSTASVPSAAFAAS